MHNFQCKCHFSISKCQAIQGVFVVEDRVPVDDQIIGVHLIFWLVEIELGCLAGFSVTYCPEPSTIGEHWPSDAVWREGPSV